MSKFAFCSALSRVLALSCVFAAFATEGCTITSTSSPDGGTTTATDSGTPLSDSGAGGVDATSDTSTPASDAGMNPMTDAAGNGPSNFTASAVAGILANPVAIDVGMLGSSCTADTDTATWNCNISTTQPAPQSVQVTLAGAGGNAVLWVLSSLTLESSTTLTVSGTKPAIFYVLGNAQIGGELIATAGNVVGMGSGVGGGTNSGTTGAGGGAFCGAGGGGFPVADGGAGGNGGTPYGTANLIPLLAGAAGGDSNGPGDPGGAIQITATGTLTVTASGSILAGGYGGHTDSITGGGGGSGGGILLEAPSVAIAGNISANGGGGGDKTGDGAGATINVNAAPGGGSGGGSGAAGTTIAGASGTGGTGGAMGGGGGGAGRIRINTSGTPSSSGVITPAQTTSCFSVGGQ